MWHAYFVNINYYPYRKPKETRTPLSPLYTITYVIFLCNYVPIMKHNNIDNQIAFHTLSMT